MTSPCQKEDVLMMIRDDLKEVKADVKEIMKFKWQITGIVVFVSAIISIGAKLL